MQEYTFIVFIVFAFFVAFILMLYPTENSKIMGGYYGTETPILNYDYTNMAKYIYSSLKEDASQ